MVTVFYCTRKSSEIYQKHIKETSGLKNIEVIEYVNDGSTSLSEAYNTAFDQAKYENIIFIHDDLILSKKWGKKIHQYLSNSDYGIIGIAGTSCLPKSGMWWENKFEMVGRVWHRKAVSEKNKVKFITYESKYSEKFPNRILPTVVVDGLFIAVNKNRIVEKFDESFDGFHFYDIPFCVNNIANEVKIGVVTDIKIIHKSIGEVNEQWHEHRKVFAEKYKSVLPLRLQPKNLIQFEESVQIDKPPKIAIIIPSKNNLDYLSRCVESIKNKTQKTIQDNTIIYIADTGSENVGDIKNTISNILVDSTINLKFIEYDYYNFSQINNDVVYNHLEDEELILFCNDDIEFVNDTLSFMINSYNKNKNSVGTIGARLYYPNGTIQHGGVNLYVLKNGTITVGHQGINSTYGASFDTKKDVFGNTGALLLVSRKRFETYGGFKETKHCFEDVILGIKMILRKKKNIYVGQAVAIHHESISRKKEADYNGKIQHDLDNSLVPIIKKYQKNLVKYALRIWN